MITPTATRNTTRSGHPTDLTHLRHHLMVLWNTLKMILSYQDYPLENCAYARFPCALG